MQVNDLNWTAKMIVEDEKTQGEIQIKFNAKHRIKQPSLKTALQNKNNRIKLVCQL